MGKLPAHAPPSDCKDSELGDAQVTMVVHRRYRDFRALRHYFVDKYPGVVVPAIPEKQSIGPFLFFPCHVMYGETQRWVNMQVVVGRFATDFVEQRRAGLTSALQKITTHPRLCRDAFLVKFLSLENFDVVVRTNTNERMTELTWATTSMHDVGQGNEESAAIGESWCRTKCPASAPAVK